MRDPALVRALAGAPYGFAGGSAEMGQFDDSDNAGGAGGAKAGALAQAKAWLRLYLDSGAHCMPGTRQVGAEGGG